MFVIEIVYNGENGWLRVADGETKDQFQFVDKLELATKYHTELAAKLDVCCVETRHQPTVVQLQEPSDGKKAI